MAVATAEEERAAATAEEEKEEAKAAEEMAAAKAAAAMAVAKVVVTVEAMAAAREVETAVAAAVAARAAVVMAAGSADLGSASHNLSSPFRDRTSVGSRKALGPSPCRHPRTNRCYLICDFQSRRHQHSPEAAALAEAMEAVVKAGVEMEAVATAAAMAAAAMVEARAGT